MIARSSPDLLGPPGAVRSCSEPSGAARSCPEQPGAARKSCPELARAEILEGHQILAVRNDSNTYCTASLGLGNNARAEILEVNGSGDLKPHDSLIQR